jgi:hypothetical protein
MVATYRPPMPDALTLATAVARSVGIAVGNDAGWVGIAELADLKLRVVVLDSLVSA